MLNDPVGDWRIKQIIPGDGWSAVYANSDGRPSTSPLVCWALIVDNAGEDVVVGITGGAATVWAEGIAAFIGYLPPNGDLRVFNDSAKNYDNSTFMLEEQEGESVS